MRVGENVSVRTRLRISILALVTAIVLAVSVLHLHGVVRATLDDVGERSATLAEQINTYVIEIANRSTASGSWDEAVRSDMNLRRLLRNSLARSSAVLDVVVTSQDGEVLAAADADRVGRFTRSGRSWREWREQNLLLQLADVYRTHTDLYVDAPIVTSGSSDPVLNVRVLISPALLRAAIEPELQNLAVISIVSLAISGVLAVLVSRMIGSSLERLGHKIDRIAQGDLESIQEDRFKVPEFVDLETKLWWLGRQYSGARADMQQMKSSVEHVLRQVDSAIFLFGPDGRLQIAGEASERLLARPRQELLGRSFDELFPSWNGPGAALSRAIASRQWLREHPVTLDRPNMPAAHLLMTVEPVQYEGAATGTLVMLRDAESRREARVDVEAARRLVALSRITSGVAHEIKNPLNAMMLHLEIACDKAQKGSDTMTELGIVKSELLRLDRVVKALLDFHRPVDVRAVTCRLGTLATDVAALIRPQADAQNVRVSVEDDAGDSVVMCDMDLLKQSILNVAVNSLEAMRTGGMLRFITRSEEKESVLVIEDTGPGIPPEIQDKIFNLYFTTKQSGTGIGLAMAYRILQLHGGTISLASEPGKGTACRLALPLATHEREVAA